MGRALTESVIGNPSDPTSRLNPCLSPSDNVLEEAYRCQQRFFRRGQDSEYGRNDSLYRVLPANQSDSFNTRG